MTDPLHLLLQVQDQDTLADQLRHRRENHPIRSELSALRTELQTAERRREEVQAQQDSILSRQADLESEAGAISSRLQSIEARMYSGDVSASRDLQAMAGEADSLRSRLGTLEDSILEAMEEAEPVGRDLAEAAEAVRRLQARALELGAELARAEAEIRTEETVHAEERSRLAQALPGDLLDRYERLRSRLGGVAVAPLANGMCGGCHLSLPATELDRIRRTDPDVVITCEQCGRILVRP